MSAAFSDAGTALHVPAQGIVAAPPVARRLDVWPQPVFVPESSPAPAWWLVGAHGGAGVSSLCASWLFAGDAMRAFPGAFAGETPFVVIVAREHQHGIDCAHDLITQHLSGFAGETTLVGLVTVAARPGKVPASLRQRLEVVAGLIGDRHWHVPWVEDWLTLRSEELPVWRPGDVVEKRRKQPPASECVPLAVAKIGDQIRSTIVDLLNTN